MQKSTRIYRTIVLLASGLVELSVAIIMAFKPEIFLKELTGEETRLAHSFGVGALAIGLLSLLLIRFRSKEVSIAGLTVLTVYHAGIGIVQHEMIAAIIFHSWLVLSFIFLLVRTVKE